MGGATSDVTLSELDWCASQLSDGRSGLPLRPGGLLLDLGCGRGGPGLWLARRLKAVLLGLDIAPEALALAREHSRGYPASYLQADFHATGLPGTSVDGAISIDAFWHSNNLGAAMRESARILKPGARLVFSLVERDRLDLGGLGLELVEEHVCQGWRERREAFQRGAARLGFVLADLTSFQRRLVSMQRERCATPGGPAAPL